MKDDKSLGELLVELTRDMSSLVRKEVRLARAEMMAAANAMIRDAVAIAIGIVLLVMGLGLLLIAAVLALALLLAPWLAALVVAAAVLAVGGLVSLRAAVSMKRLRPLPRRTMETLKEDAQWATQQMR